MFSKLSSKFTTGQHLDLRLVFLVSALVSAWLIAIDPIINRDAIIYLRAADAYLQSGIVASQSTFDRPLLPIIFASLHGLTGIPLVHAGLIMTSLYYALICVGFVATIRVMGGDRRVQLIAAVIILSHPMLNGYRASIMRDPAYWAFSILAFRELLLYVRSPVLKHQLRWFIYIALAALFRVEGVFFAALAPVAVFLVGEPGQRWRPALRLMILPALSLTAVTGVVLFYQSAFSPAEPLFPDIASYIRKVFAISKRFGEMSGAPAQHWLEFTSKEDAAIAAGGGLAAVMAINIIRALTWPYFAVLCWGGIKRLFDRIPPRDLKLILAQLAIGLLYLVLFLLAKRFMLERYSGILVLFLLLFLPYILNAMWSSGKKWGARFLVAFLLVGMSLDTLHNTDYEKAYIGDATEWLIAKTPENATLASNSTYIAYFSRRNYPWEHDAHRYKVADLDTNQARWRDADYLVILMKRDERNAWREFLAEQGLEETKSFDGGRHGKVGIVQLKAPRRR